MANDKRVAIALVAAIAAIGIAIAIAYFNDGAKAATPQTHTITIENMQFNPAILMVGRSDRVIWTNKDLFAHTATAADQSFDSRDIAPNTSWTYVADKPGDHAYVCTLHPTMKGQLTVR